MYGARQVGKTYIIKEFGNNEFENMVYINCYKNKSIAQLFQGDANAERLSIGLAAYAHQDITPGKTLVFLDEIQKAICSSCQVAHHEIAYSQRRK